MTRWYKSGGGPGSQVWQAASGSVLLFYATGLHRRVDQMGADAPTPVGARLVGAASLVLWIGVVYWGRMLPFIGNAF